MHNHEICWIFLFSVCKYASNIDNQQVVPISAAILSTKSLLEKITENQRDFQIVVQWKELKEKPTGKPFPRPKQFSLGHWISLIIYQHLRNCKLCSCKATTLHVMEASTTSSSNRWMCDIHPPKPTAFTATVRNCNTCIFREYLQDAILRIILCHSVCTNKCHWK